MAYAGGATLIVVGGTGLAASIFMIAATGGLSIVVMPFALALVGIGVIGTRHRGVDPSQHDGPSSDDDGGGEGDDEKQHTEETVNQ
jgi:hypothetical protein